MKCIWKVSDSESICCYYFPLIIGLNNEMSVSVAFETVHPVYFLEVSLQSHPPPPPPPPFFFLFCCVGFFFVSFSLKLITGGACVKMASLTLCISMCHTASKALPANFCQGSMSAVFKNRVGLQQEDWQSQTPYTSYLKRSIYFTFSIKILIESSI